VVQASSASDRWVLEVGGRRVERTDAYGWADAFAVPEGSGPGDAVLAYRAPASRYALLAVQLALWLAVLAVAVRMRFGSEATPARPDDADASEADDRGDGDPARAGPPPDDEAAREGEPVPAGAGAPA
jgi:hypothetical protein